MAHLKKYVIYDTEKKKIVETIEGKTFREIALEVLKRKNIEIMKLSEERIKNND